MTRHPGLWQWQQIVSTRFPHLSRPQALLLALWSVGIVLAQRCGLSSVALVLATVLGQTVAAMHERLRDWYRCAPHKSGARRGVARRSLEVRTCFAPLLRWVIDLHPADCRQLALALDTSTLGTRFTILTISVVIRGCAIPVAWHVVGAREKGAWQPQWEALFAQLQGVVPTDWTVIVAADRGLWARWLFTSITALGWHPFLRITRKGHYRPEGSATYRPLTEAVTNGGRPWRGRVTCFASKQRQIACTLLARWDVGYRDPWLVLTDLPPAQADVAWYGLRAWIECGYKDAKRGGWHWEQTKMTDPRRAERLWLVMAIATLWVVSVGCQAETTHPVAVLDALPETHVARRQATGRPRPRTLSCFRHGHLLLLAALVQGQDLPPMALIPEPWPKSLDTDPPLSQPAAPHQYAA